jgi:hypothetical protein
VSQSTLLSFRSLWIRLGAIAVIVFLSLQIITSTILLFREATNPPALEYSHQFYNANPHDVCAGQAFHYQTELRVTQAPVVFRVTRTVVAGRATVDNTARTVYADLTPEYYNIMATKAVTGNVTYVAPATLLPGQYTLLVGVSSEGVRDAIYGVEFDIVEC